MNRLTNLAVNNSSGAIASYAYTLDPAGHRTQVTELSGRTVQYGYDSLYRLTSETISGAVSQNGAIGYVYDSVGNRMSMTSTVPAMECYCCEYLSVAKRRAANQVRVGSGLREDYDDSRRLLHVGGNQLSK
jgi:YD repeat-containing protein